MLKAGSYLGIGRAEGAGARGNVLQAGAGEVSRARAVPRRTDGFERLDLLLDQCLHGVLVQVSWQAPLGYTERALVYALDGLELLCLSGQQRQMLYD